MSLLLRLPNETLVQIFDQVSSSFFREDLARLTVCRQWFQFALPALYRSVSLSRETLRALVASRAITQRSTLEDSLETLDLELDRYQSGGPMFHYQTNAHQFPGILRIISLAEVPRDEPHRAWIDALNEDLAQLAAAAQRSRRLGTLRVRSWRARSSEDNLRSDSCPLVPEIKALLSVENLSVLELDLFSGFFERGQSHHICPAIGALLCTLQTLHLRLRTICPDALKPRDPGNKLRLNVVAVNLELKATQPPMGVSVAPSQRCGSAAGGQPPLRAAMQKQAEALATRMASPKAVRILEYLRRYEPPKPLSYELRSFDVLTGKTMVLDDDMAWDDDGRIVESEGSGPE